MAASRIRDNQLLLILLAGTVLVVAVVFGLLSRGHSAPAPATLPTVAAEPDPLDQQIDAVVEAVGDVGVTVTADGVESTFAMGAGETRTFTAQTDLLLAVTDGGAIRLTVNGVDYGIPGTPGQPWRRSRISFGTTDGSDAVGVSVRAEIVGVGTELLLGQIANTNARWISERLATVGVDVLHHQAVGDNIPRIIEALNVALGRADVVLVTGGLGPTEDDLTRDAIAELLGAPMVRHPEIEDLLREKFAGYGRGDMPLSNLRQADVPDGVRTITPDRGTAPGLVADLPDGQADLRGARRPDRDGGDDGGDDPPGARGARRTGDDRLADAPLRQLRGVAGGGTAPRPVRGVVEPERRLPGILERGEGSPHRQGARPSRRRGRCSRPLVEEVRRQARRRRVHRGRRGARAGGRTAAPGGGDDARVRGVAHRRGRGGAADVRPGGVRLPHRFRGRLHRRREARRPGRLAGDDRRSGRRQRGVRARDGRGRPPACSAPTSACR